jgi:hypothetical protein
MRLIRRRKRLEASGKAPGVTAALGWRDRCLIAQHCVSAALTVYLNTTIDISNS